MARVNIERLRSSDAQQSATILNPILQQRALQAEAHPDEGCGEVAQVSPDRLRFSDAQERAAFPKLYS